jgi:hypothetical protein
MSILFTSVPQKILKQSILGSSTTFSINNIKGWDGKDLKAADFGTVGYGAFMSADKTRLEFFEWDASTIAASVINFNKRGLQFDGDLTTEVDANKLDWTANETYVMLGADTPQVFQWLKEYIDGIAVAGSPDMSTTDKGLAEEATQAEVDAKTAAGGTLARLAVNPSTLRATKYNDYVADTVGTDSYAITVDPVITAYAAGQEFTFKAGTANTGACTLNVCSLGAKSILKDVSLELNTGDILQNQIVKVIYDGTNFQFVSTRIPLVPVVRTYLNAASPATWTKPAGLKYIEVEVQGGGGGGGTGDSSRTGGSGGAAGGYSFKKILESSLGATETVTIGAGGSANNGGSTSSFGTHLSATGGNPGASGGGTSSGGSGSGGDINIQGQSGQQCPSGFFSSTGSSNKASGAGGSSKFGFGGTSVWTNGAGLDGVGYGSGGSGGGNDGNTGGSGAPGIVIIKEFY